MLVIATESYTEFHENATIGLVADTRSPTDGLTSSLHKPFCFLLVLCIERLTTDYIFTNAVLSNSFPFMIHVFLIIFQKAILSGKTQTSTKTELLEQAVFCYMTGLPISLHRSESLRSEWLLSQSRNSTHLLEPKASLLSHRPCCYIYFIQTNSCTLFKTHSHSHLKH